MEEEEKNIHNIKKSGRQMVLFTVTLTGDKNGACESLNTMYDTE